MIKSPNPLFACQDGLTAVYGSHAWNRGKERPADFIARTMRMMETEPVTNFAGVSVYAEPSQWEFAYLADKFRPLSENGYDAWAAYRRPWVGYHILSVNFDTISHGVRIVTRDLKLVAAWQQAIDNNPGGAAARKWHEDVAAEHAEKRRLFEKRQERVREQNNS